MKAPELLAILEDVYPDSEITREHRPSRNTKGVLDNIYVDGKLAIKGSFGKPDSFHFCNSFRVLLEVL